MSTYTEHDRELLSQLAEGLRIEQPIMASPMARQHLAQAIRRTLAAADAHASAQQQVADVRQDLESMCTRLRPAA